jgi:hypothetical protein
MFFNFWVKSPFFIWLLVLTPLNNISQWEGLSHISHILWKIIQMFETTKQHISLTIINHS